MSSNTRQYTFICGEQGRISYNNGTAQGSLRAVLMYYFGNQGQNNAQKQALIQKWGSRFKSMGLVYTPVGEPPVSQWQFNIVIDVNTLDATEIQDLDDFIENNKSVLGRYPPQLLNPAVSFTHEATSSTSLVDMASDLIGRGMDAGLTLTKGDDLELWYDHELSQAEQNRITAMWSNRLKDPDTGNPL
jgi:hypothetical protein